MEPSKIVKIHDLYFEPLILAADIRERVGAIGAILNRDYLDRNPLFISILNGSFIFTADLVRSFDGQCEVRFVKLSSYAGTQSVGSVTTVMGIDVPIADRDIILVEDIVDSGRTFVYFIEQLRKAGPASIRTVSLLVKPDAHMVDVHVDLWGFQIENRFVVGYGLDYDEAGRNLPDIYVKIDD
jgi:hypoxanthine phosphoribosyltransferase